MSVACTLSGKSKVTFKWSIMSPRFSIVRPPHPYAFAGWVPMNVHDIDVVAVRFHDDVAECGSPHGPLANLLLLGPRRRQGRFIAGYGALDELNINPADL